MTQGCLPLHPSSTLLLQSLDLIVFLLHLLEHFGMFGSGFLSGSQSGLTLG